MSYVGLVLSGGGARGAYQAGVIAALAHIAKRMNVPNPFQIYAGVSAGSINTALLVANSKSFFESAERLVKAWTQISTDQVFYADLLALSRGGAAMDDGTFPRRRTKRNGSSFVAKYASVAKLSF